MPPVHHAEQEWLVAKFLIMGAVAVLYFGFYVFPDFRYEFTETLSC